MCESWVNNTTTVQDTGAGNVKITGIEDVYGSLDTDTIIGNSSSNILKGFAGNDTLIGNEGDDSLYGGAGNDKLLGGAGNDLLEGEAGDDSLIGGAGNDTINGGSGIDTVDYSLEAGRLRVILGADDSSASATIGTSDTDILSSIENVIGTSYNDEITGNNKANSIDAGSGNDTLDGGVDSQIDILNGSAGNDTFILRADSGVDIINGGVDSDTVDYSSLSSSDNLILTLDSANSTIATITNGSLVYTDTIENIENIKSGAGDDTLKGSDVDNIIISGSGNDILSGGKGDDYIDGGYDTDTIDYRYVTSGTGVSVNLTLNSASDMFVDTFKQVGNDQLYNIENVKGTAYADSIIGNGQNNILEGNSGNDFLDGKAGNDSLLGGLGDDTLKGGTGDDILNGGDGIDTADYSDVENEDLIIDLTSQGEKTISTLQGKDTFISIEGAIGGQGDDILIGTSGANTLVGEKGNDTIIGNGASSGTDYIDGGENDLGAGDLVSFTYTNKNLKVDLSFNTGSNANVAQVSGDGNLIIKNIEDLLGGFGNDTLIGNDDKNTISGGTGNDTLVGKGGNDYLDGGVNEYSHKFTVNGTATVGNNYTLQIGTILISFLATSANANDIIAGLLNAFETNNDAKKVASLIKVTEGSTDTLYLYTSENVTNLNGLVDTSIEYSDTADYSSGGRIVVDMDASTDTSIIEKGLVSLEDGSIDTLVSIENIIGSNYNDTIYGDTNDNISNIFDGGLGDDTIYGGSGDDTIYGGLGNDLLDGGLGNDLLDGGSGSDTLKGGAGNDTLKGGAGNDTFVETGLDGNDSIDGGDGIDTVDYSSVLNSDSDLSTGGITVNLNQSTATVIVNGGNDDTLKNIENIIGTQNNDTITASTTVNILNGEAGNDTFIQTNSGSSSDTIDGGADNDTVDYTALSTGIVLSLNSNSYVSVTSGSSVHQIKNIENIIGTTTDDTIFGDGLNNSLNGSSGNDTLRGGLGNDTIDGGADKDTLSYENINSSLVINLQTGIATGEGNDVIRNIETVIAGNKDDKIIMSLGTSGLNDSTDNTIYGGLGKDTVSYEVYDSTKRVFVDLTEDKATIYDGSSEEIDYLYDIESIIGGAGNDTLYGNGFANSIDGGAGNDTLRGNEGNDTLNGNTGEDIVDYSHINNAIEIDLRLADSQVINDGSGTKDTLISIETIIASTSNDSLTGSNTKDVIYGRAGNDYFVGNAGNDTLFGELGDDTFEATSLTDGSDFIDGGSSSESNGDTIDYSKILRITDGTTGGITVDLKDQDGTSTATVVVNSGNNDTIDNIENVFGTQNNDTIYGNDTKNTLYGNSGDDTFRGGLGNDYIDGGASGETIGDTVDYSYSSSAIKVDLSDSTVVAIVDINSDGIFSSTIDEKDTLVDIENILGSTGNDTITGDSNKNILSGNAGQDTLNGNAGQDTLNGGTGNDYLNGGADLDTLRGEDGDDTLIGGSGNDILIGGNHTIDSTGTQGTTTSYIGKGDTADYSVANNGIGINVNMLRTQDITDSTTYAVQEDGLGGKDYLDGIENIIGTIYSDTVVGDNNKNYIFGGLGNDTLSGGKGNDSLEGGAGNDIIKATSYDDGNDIIDGEKSSVIDSGIDTVDYSIINNLYHLEVNLSSSNVGTIQASKASIINNSDSSTTQTDTLLNIENIIGTLGDDTFIGDTENNTFDGISGNDTVDYSDNINNAYVEINLSSSSTTINGKILVANKAVTNSTIIDTDTLYNIENINGTIYSDIIVGNESNNILNGNAGNDILRGGAGNDTLIGGTGIDTADFSDASENLDVNIEDGTKFISTSQGQDTFSSIEGIIGGSGNDTLTGNTNANTLIGNAGNDILNGAGTSTAASGEYDYLDGGDGKDSVSYKNFSNPLTINLGLTYDNTSDVHNFDATSVKDYQNAGAAGNIRILNVENLEAGSGNDTIYGNSSDNTLIGREGNDTFRGEAGNDVIVGGVVTSSQADGTILTQTDSSTDVVDYSSLSSGKGIIVNMNVPGENDATLNKGEVTQDGYDGYDLLYGIEKILGSKYNDLIIGDTDDNVNNLTFAR